MIAVAGWGRVRVWRGPPCVPSVTNVVLDSASWASARSVLDQLVRHAGKLVTKDELLAAVWPVVVVTDDSLVQAISDVRRALGEAGHRIVRTIPRRGYMLLAPMQPPPAPASPAESASAGLPRSP